MGASNTSISFDLAELGLIPGDGYSVALTDFALDLTADEFNYKIEFGQISAVPVPAAFGTGQAGFAGFREAAKTCLIEPESRRYPCRGS